MSVRIWPMRQQELALYSADSMPAHMHEPETAHLAEFSGFKGRDDQAVPDPDEVSTESNCG
jgi:hypothetical protein